MLFGELVKIEKIALPDITFIGKFIDVTFAEIETENSPIPEMWDKAFEDGWFDILGATPNFLPDYIGLCVDMTEKGLTYGIGVLKPIGATPPDGFISHDIPAGDVAWSWIRGGDTQVCLSAWTITAEAIKARGLGKPNTKWSMEIYNCPRWTEPDERGLVTLDYYLPIER